MKAHRKKRSKEKKVFVGKMKETSTSCNGIGNGSKW
jgi:hypothetical protein